MPLYMPMDLMVVELGWRKKDRKWEWTIVFWVRTEMTKWNVEVFLLLGKHLPIHFWMSIKLFKKMKESICILGRMWWSIAMIRKDFSVKIGLKTKKKKVWGVKKYGFLGGLKRCDKLNLIHLNVSIWTPYFYYYAKHLKFMKHLTIWDHMLVFVWHINKRMGFKVTHVKVWGVICHKDKIMFIFLDSSQFFFFLD